MKINNHNQIPFFVSLFTHQKLRTITCQITKGFIYFINRKLSINEYENCYSYFMVPQSVSNCRIDFNPLASLL